MYPGPTKRKATPNRTSLMTAHQKVELAAEAGLLRYRIGAMGNAGGGSVPRDMGSVLLNCLF